MAKKRFGMKNFFFSFVIVCIVIYIFQNSYGSVDTMIAEKGTLEDIIKANGIIIKDEEVFSSSADGSLNCYYEDGDKVSKGQLVADINTGSSSVQIASNKVSYYSSNSGIITYKIDGLEDKYIYENVLKLSPSATTEIDYVEIDASKNTAVANGDKIFKIIRNFDYYIAATVNNEYAKLFEENKYIRTRVLADGVESEVWGYIKKINYGSEESVLIIYFDDFFHKVYDKRYVDLQLITGIHDGLKIDVKSLIQKDGITGVYVKDASNIVKFFPVEILGKDEQNAVVYIGDYVSEHKRRTILINEEKYETIKIFDKMILEPEKVYEGQILK